MVSPELLLHLDEKMKPVNLLNLVQRLADRDGPLPVVFEYGTLLFQEDVCRQNERPEANERRCAHQLVVVETEQLFGVGKQNLDIPARRHMSVTTTLKQRVGKRLRKIRRNQDFTQEQLAEAVGVTAESISNIERGKTAPSFETLEKIAEVLQVPVREFFDFPEEK